ncbi:MAG: hypothetical protein OHK006_19380 [Thermodesulfovibrionales bacterium]
MGTSYDRTRRHKRLTHVVTFAYCCTEKSTEIMFGVTSNISAAGMCIYSDTWLDTGDVIEFRSSLPVPFRRAAVKWIRRDVNALYKIGLKFVG